MGQSSDELNEIYRQTYTDVRLILEKHFPSVDVQKLPDLTHLFLAEKFAALYENWNYNEQQACLTRLRAQLQKASETLSKIHRAVMDEVSVNLTLPLLVLNGTYNRKTCAEEVFDLALGRAEVETAQQVFKGLLSFGENIDKAIKYTQDELPEGIFAGNRNIDAWRVVEAAVEVCRRYPDAINVPKKINGNGPLYHLLVDLLAYYKIKANVDAAFNGWAKHIERKRDSLDLLPID
jgi:hypothetical protein